MITRKTTRNDNRVRTRNQMINIPEEFRDWRLDCPTCQCKRQVVSSITANRAYDATEVYTLDCGHKVI